MSTHQKLSIQHSLASILNLSPTDDEDYISEILEQLLSIDSSDDVTEYLANFVTDESLEHVGSFVEELGRFKSGGDVAVAPIDADEEQKPSAKEICKHPEQTSAASRILDEGAAQREEIRLREIEAREKQREEQERLRLKKLEEKEEQLRRKQESEIKNKKNQKSASSWEKKKPAQSGAAINNVKSDQSTTSRQKASTKKPSKANSQHHQPSKPLQGTPKTICGCFGQKHPPLTNCLHCGRISCQHEGYDYCPFCSNLITQFTPLNNSGEVDSATAHKERLLEYDRTSASRTHVHDDQEDYFVTQSSMWSSVEEQEEAGLLEEERRRKLHVRGNQVLDLQF